MLRSARTASDRRQSLRGVPVLHTNVSIDEQGNGLVTLVVRIAAGNSFLDRFRPKGTTRRYELDEFGTAVVRGIDGETSVIELVDRFHEQFRLSRREAELGVVAFIKMLMKRHVLSVISR